MLTKTQKVVMYVIGILTLLMGLVLCIPFRTVTFFKGDVLTVEMIVKCLALPLVAMLLSAYPLFIKNSQIKVKGERSKIVNVLTYLPALVYIAGMLILVIHTLTYEFYPMTAISHGLLLAMAAVYLTLAVALIFLMNHFTMVFAKKGNLIIDVIGFACLVLFAFVGWRVLYSYANLYKEVEGYIYTSANYDPYLFFLYIILFFVIIFYLFRFLKLMKADESLVYSYKMTEEQINAMIAEQYSKAYNDILDEFEDYFDEETESLAAEDEVGAEEAEAEEEPVEEGAEEAEGEEAEEENAEGKAKEDELAELEAMIKDIDAFNDSEVSKRVAELKKEIQEEKAAIEQGRADLEAYQKEAAEQKQALLDKLAEYEKPEEVEEAPVVEKKKVLKPSFESIYNFAMQFVDDSVRVAGKIDEETGLGKVKLSKGRTPFLILQNTTNDYRVTFLATEENIDNYLTSGDKRFSIPKDAKSNKMVKFVNKGQCEANFVKGLVREAVKGIKQEVEQKENEKAQ